MKPAYKTAGLAAALGIAAWLLAPVLLPVKLPPDFPALPDLKPFNPALRAAVEAADKEARRKPGSAEAVGKLALVYHANMLFEQAAPAYRIAARLAPRDVDWIYGQAYLQEETGNEKEQVRLLRETLRLQPAHVPSLIKLADWSFKADRLDEAERYYELAARVNGGAAVLQGTLGLGRIASRRRDWKKVLDHILPLTRSYSHVLAVHELLREAYTGLGQTDNAAASRHNADLAQWKVVPPADDPFTDRLLAVCHSTTRLLKQAGVFGRVGRPDRAIDIARRATQADPSEPDAHNYLARALLTFFADKPEAVEEGLNHLAECLRLRPDDLLPLWSFTDDFFKSPKTPAATQRLRGLLAPHAGRDDAHYYLGLVAEAGGDAAEAAAQFRAAIKHDPGSSAAYHKLGVVLLASGKLNEAVPYLQKAVQLNGGNYNARLNLGVALMERGDYGQALKELGELLQLTPNDAAARSCMGFSYLYSRRPQEAEREFRYGLRLQPGDPDARYGLASALAAQRKRDDALAEVRQALSLRPNFPAAQELLQQLAR